MRRAHAMPFGAAVTREGVRFALWSPTAREVALIVDGAERAMPAAEDGWRRLVAPEARAGSRYAYRIDGDLVVPDPASRFQPDDVGGPSMVIDPCAYAWSDHGWRGRPWEEAVLYEVHVGTATPEGTYAGLAAKLDALADLGITAIELMPLGDFPGRRNWGYDGVLPFAPDSSYGTPDDLKRLIDATHARGIMAFLDVVYNHFGPAGNYLHAYARTFFTERHQTPWGAGINFDGADGRPVRDFFIHNALYWLEEYHADGLRFDAVHAMVDDSEPHIIAEIAERVRTATAGRHVHLVLENEANEARWLARASRRPQLHTAQWNDDLHHCWHTLLTGEADGYYQDFADDPVGRLGRALAEGFAYQGDPSRHRRGKPRGEPSADLPPSAFVAFLQNHDQIGNRAFGERLTELVAAERVALARAALLLSPQIPLLYMGEEWAASAPFLFFVDFAADAELSAAVRDGRQREFAHFKSFTEQHGGRQIPDPTLPEAFASSTLSWHEAATAPHAAVREEVRHLLRLRRDAIVPLAKTDFRGATRATPAPQCLDVTWRFAGGTLRLLANFGEHPVELAARDLGRVVWSSPGVSTRPDGVGMPAWTGLFAKASAA